MVNATKNNSELVREFLRERGQNQSPSQVANEINRRYRPEKPCTANLVSVIKNEMKHEQPRRSDITAVQITRAAELAKRFPGTKRQFIKALEVVESITIS